VAFNKTIYTSSGSSGSGSLTDTAHLTGSDGGEPEPDAGAGGRVEPRVHHYRHDDRLLEDGDARTRRQRYVEPDVPGPDHRNRSVPEHGDGRLPLPDLNAVVASSTSSHSVNLFQPSITVTKTASNGYSRVG